MSTRIGLPLALTLALLPLLTFGQISAGGAFDQAVTPSPGAAALARVAAMPVNLSKGTVNVNVPLGAMEGYSMSLPLSLSYHTAGIKVNDVPTSVGLGWALNASGVVTRVVRGRPDDDLTLDGSVSRGYSGPNFATAGTAAKVAALANQGQGTISNGEADKFARGEWDSEPDIFYFSCNGLAGRFLLDKDKNPVLVPHQNLKITHLRTQPYSGTRDLLYSTWVITTPDGTSYVFGNPNLNAAIIANRYDGVEKTRQTTVVPGFSDYLPEQTTTTEFASSWYLNEIISAQGNTEMTLEYETGNPVSYANRTALQYELLSQTDASLPKHTPGNEVKYVGATTRIDNPLYLRAIKAPGKGKVEFSYENAPLVTTVSSGKKLVAMQLYNRDNQLLRKTRFGYSYFNYLTSYPNPPVRRLMLEQVVEEGLPPHRFEYYTGLNNDLPERNSSAIDHWGYYNGRNSNGNPIPGFSYFDPRLNITLTKTGADHEPNEAAARANSLRKITFPTGGTVEYEYQLNRYQRPGIDDNQAFGGLRIGRITVGDGRNAARNLVTDYTYTTEDPAQSSGTVDPTFATTPQYTKKVIFHDDPSGFDHRYAQFLLRSSQPYNPHELVTGDWLVYRRVTVSQSGQGKTVHHFTSFADQADVLAPKYEFGRPNPYTSPNQPPYNVPNTTRYFVRGLPADTKVYDAAGRLKSWHRTEYQSEESPETREVVGLVFHKDDIININGSYFASTKAIPASTYYGVYRERAGWVHPYRVTQVLYDQQEASRFTKTVTEYVHNPLNQQVAEMRQTDSDGRTLITRYQYAVDYPHRSPNVGGESVACDPRQPQFDSDSPPPSLRDASSVINEMRRRNMTGIPIETRVWQRRGNEAPTLLSASLQEFAFRPRPRYRFQQLSFDLPYNAQDFSQSFSKSTMIVPTRVHQLPTDVPLADFQTSNLDDNGQLTRDGRYVLEATLDRYSPTGLLLQGTSRDDAPNAALYEQTTGYLMAKVSRAEYARIAYSSFETAGETGNWQYSGAATAGGKTGTQSYSGSVSSQANLPADSYLVSLWIRGSGSVTVNGNPLPAGADWTYHQVRLTNPGTVTVVTGGSAWVDELRLHPVGSKMTTYTHQAGVGVSSESDANGKSLTYSYDALQRAKTVKDPSGNIVKQYQYGYQNRDAPVWMETGVTRCQAGPTGPTGVVEREQEDVNPAHRSNGQTPRRWVLGEFDISFCVPCPAGYRWINGVCKRYWLRTLISSTKNDLDATWTCVYRYDYQDGTFVESTEISNGECPNF